MFWPFRRKGARAKDADEARKSSKPKKPVKGSNKLPESSVQPTYVKPKILLVDMPDSCAQVLREAGYNVSLGTFGTPYEVEPGTALKMVSRESCSLPGIEEQEIIIANTRRTNPSRGTTTEKVSVIEGKHLWQSSPHGVIDPRPLSMSTVAADVDRIRHHGGIVIVLVSQRYEVEYVVGEATDYGHVHTESEARLTNWSFLPDLNEFSVTDQVGEEIIFEGNKLGRFLKRAAEGAEYSCTLEPDYDHKDTWFSLAQNKYGEVVAGLLLNDEETAFQVLVALPQMPNLHTVIIQLLENWCARWNPALFPHLKSLPWLHDERYEIPRVVELRQKIANVKDGAKAQIDALEDEIKRTREQEAGWYELLSGTGDDLVTAVIQSLQQLGFKKVLNVDEDQRAKSQGGSLKEDIQVDDRSPVLVVDVKGVTGRPDDEETRQSEKHARLRMMEWDRTDVQPLTIVNHERHVPPHEREEQAYRQEMIDYAEHAKMGIMTTFDIFRLLRNKEKHGWSSETVLSVFYRIGRIEPVPEHYTYIGEITNLWRSAFGVVPKKPVRVGTVLAVEAGPLFDEFEVTSLMVDDQGMQEAPEGSNCGVGFGKASKKLRKGMRVFLVENAASRDAEPEQANCGGASKE